MTNRPAAITIAVPNSTRPLGHVAEDRPGSPSAPRSSTCIRTARSSRRRRSGSSGSAAPARCRRRCPRRPASSRHASDGAAQPRRAATASPNSAESDEKYTTIVAAGSLVASLRVKVAASAAKNAAAIAIDAPKRAAVSRPRLRPEKIRQDDQHADEADRHRRPAEDVHPLAAGAPRRGRPSPAASRSRWRWRRRWAGASAQ